MCAWIRRDTPIKALARPLLLFLGLSLISRAISSITHLPANPATYFPCHPTYLTVLPSISLPALMISTLATDMKSCARFISALHSHIFNTLNSSELITTFLPLRYLLHTR